ncbi:nuclear transport factor 2 family protein [Streptomyces fuscichromogenes]|uniref:SnoaL-like domain-containing protein n=1 Tax=Streptomyces fuscichromogenes TaxID=1324013 RepID=A0A917XQH8_9ACTN|nr:nuclear transport factor 2 family protein [Streptomyces fuscichromogenes]GGN45647.1 hypothetical protein GCM10011578_097820 [Streptomyces fuscichromogenes]
MTTNSSAIGNSIEALGHEENCRVLRYIYEDFDRLVETASEGIVLHPAGRRSEDDDIHGLAKALEHERALLAATGGTLFMDVQYIAANEYFGTVMGMIRAKVPADVVMPFCGLWRFADGKLVEHWENPFAPAKLAGRLKH